MSHIHKLHNLECGIALSLALTTSAQTAENTPVAPNATAKQQFDSKPITTESKPVWAPTQQPSNIGKENGTEAQPELPVSAATTSLDSQMLAQQKRELWESRRAELNTRYQELRQQAAADGVELSQQTPWEDTKESDNLERMQTVINNMTPEERDVCTTVHRLSMGLMQSSVMPPPQSPPPPLEPNRYGYSEYGRVPNYGYNAYPYSNAPVNPYPNTQGGYGYPASGYGYGRGAGYRTPDYWQGGGGW